MFLCEHHSTRGVMHVLSLWVSGANTTVLGMFLTQTAFWRIDDVCQSWGG